LAVHGRKKNLTLYFFKLLFGDYIQNCPVNEKEDETTVV